MSARSMVLGSGGFFGRRGAGSDYRDCRAGAGGNGSDDGGPAEHWLCDAAQEGKCSAFNLLDRSMLVLPSMSSRRREQRSLRFVMLPEKQLNCYQVTRHGIKDWKVMGPKSEAST
ncbi:unnamed protein product [Urochloa humidicola]